MKIAGRREYFGDAPLGVWWIDGVEPVVFGRRDGPAPWPAHQRNVGEIRAGDLTLHVSGGEIAGVGRATDNGRLVSGPPAGWLVDIAVEPLDVPVPLSELPATLKPGPPYPFNLVGRVQPGTCYPYPFDVAGQLARQFDGFWPEGSAWATLAAGGSLPERGEAPVDGGEAGTDGDDLAG